MLATFKTAGITIPNYMEQPPPQLDDQPETAPTSSLFSRLFGVLATPSDVFEEIRRTKVLTVNWVMPMLLLIVLGWIGAVLVFSQENIRHQLDEMTDKGIQKQIEKQHMPEEQAEKAREMGRKFGSLGTKITMVVAPIMMGVLAVFWWGFLMWLGAKLWLKTDLSYAKAMEGAGLANMVNVLEAIIKPLLIISLGNLFAGTNLALFVKEYDPQNPVHGILAAVDVMTFWILIVRAICLARFTNTSFVKAAAWVFGVWILMTGTLTGFGLAMQAIFNRGS